MRLCSAACRVPRSFGICSRPSSCAARAEPDRLRLEGRLGHEQRDDVDRRSVSHGLARVADDLLGHRDPSEVELDTESLCRLHRLLDRRLRLLLHLRVPVDARRADDRDPILDRQRIDEVLLPEVEVDRALVHGRVRPVALDEPEERARLAVHDVNDSMRRPIAARCALPGSRGPSRRIRPGVLELGELGARRSASRPSVSESSAAIGASNAAARTCGSRIRGFA